MHEVHDRTHEYYNLFGVKQILDGCYWRRALFMSTMAVLHACARTTFGKEKISEEFRRCLENEA